MVKPKERWRADGQEVGFSTPTIGDGALYIMTNSGRCVALDLKTGEGEKSRELAAKLYDCIGRAMAEFVARGVPAGKRGDR